MYKRKLITPANIIGLITFIPLFLGLFAHFLDIRWQVFMFNLEVYGNLIPPINEMTIVAFFLTILCIVLSSHYISFKKEGILWEGIFTSRFISSTQITSYTFGRLKSSITCKIKVKDGKDLFFSVKKSRTEKEITKILDDYILQNTSPICS